MNERIKKLEKQCEVTKFLKEDTDKGSVSVTTTYFDREKFAELIIQECISIVENMPPGYKDYRDQIEDAFRRDCIELMKERFGVK